MARLTFEDGTQVDDFERVAESVASLGLELGLWPLGESQELRGLLDSAVLGPEQKEKVLAHLQHYFDELAASDEGCRACDLVVLHPEVPGLDEKLATFAKCHVHPDDEVRYIIDGEGVFGVVLPDGTQVELVVQAPEFLRVPKGTEHWFRLTEINRVKAVRYFSEADGWEADFTGTEVRLPA